MKSLALPPTGSDGRDDFAGTPDFDRVVRCSRTGSWGEIALTETGGRALPCRDSQRRASGLGGSRSRSIVALLFAFCTSACRAPTPEANVAVARPASGAGSVAVRTGALTGYKTPFLDPPPVAHIFNPGMPCDSPVLAHAVPDGFQVVRFVARGFGGHALSGGISDFGGAVKDSYETGNCSDPLLSQSGQDGFKSCGWKYSADIYPYFCSVQQLEPLATPARISDIVAVHEPGAYVLFKPGAGCATLNEPGNNDCPWPFRFAMLPAFPEGSAAAPSTGATDAAGNLHVLAYAGTRIINVGEMGGDDPVELKLTGKSTAPLPDADRPERIGFSDRNLLLASNRSGLFRVHKGSGYVERLYTWPTSPVDDFGPKGKAPCCDLVHLSDPRGGSVWLVNPPGQPDIWVLDGDTAMFLSKWPISPPGWAEPPQGMRQLRAILSTGIVYGVIQFQSEPDYKGRVVFWKYPVWDGTTPVGGP